MLLLEYKPERSPEEKEERRLVLGEIKEKYQLPKYFKVTQTIDAIRHL